MVTTMKKAVLFLMVVLLMIGACGCMQHRTEDNTKDNMINNMVQYMNEKYPDDTFNYKGPFGGGAGSSTKTIVVSSKKYPDANIYVRHQFSEGDIYTDNYLGIKYTEQTKSAIKEVFDSVLSYDYLLFYDVEQFACPNKTGTMDFADYISSDESRIGFTVVVNGVIADKATFENALKNKIIDKGICCSATIYFDNGSGAFDKLEAEGLSGYTFKELYSDVFIFEMKSDKEFSSSQWGD